MATATRNAELSVAVDEKPASQVELKVEAPAAELDLAVEAAIRRIARQLRVPGFRPGKAPAAVVERMVGWETVRQEAVEELVPDLYMRALDQTHIQPVGDPQVTLGEIERGQPVTFTATVTIRPTVELGDLSDFRVDEETTEVTDAQVEETLADVRRRNGELVTVERPSQAGDVLRCRLTMRREGEVLSNADEERDLDLDREKLLPGMADAVVGLSTGDERSFELTLPEDYPREELRGAAVQVDIAVSAVRERTLPELDDELARADGNAETVEGMREHYRNRLHEVAAETDAEHYETAVLEALRDRVSIEVPEAMIDAEVDRQVGTLERQIAQMGMSFDAYLQYTGSSREKLRGEAREAAGHRVKLDLALDALAGVESLEVDEAQVEREEVRIAAGQKLTRDQHRRLHEISHRDLTRQAAVQRAVEIARGE